MTDLTETEIDWEAAGQISAMCGARTRALVSGRDLYELRPWVLQLSREHRGPAAASYYELAVVVGAISPPPLAPILALAQEPEDHDHDFDDGEDDE